MSRRATGRPLDGWLVLDKPFGLTSTGAVGRARRLLDARKAGHGGTLDPLATGLLPIAFGAATRTVPYVMDGVKVYRVTVRFGERRATDDAEGAVVECCDARPSDHAIEAALASFRGDILQVPPAFSALKVAGRRAYDLARAGQPPVLPPRPARIDRFVLEARPDADHAVFAVASGKGVYMRSLARDLAAACGTVGHVAALRRLRVGPFGEEDAISLDNLEREAENRARSPDLLLPIATALADIPALAATDTEADRLANGAPIGASVFGDRLPDRVETPDGLLVRVMAGERVLGLCRLRDGWLRLERSLQPHPHGEE